MSFNREEAERVVRDLIRSGKKTSEIILATRFPVEFIKSIKSEELEAEKKMEKMAEAARLQVARDAKEDRRNKEFLAKYDLTKPDNDASKPVVVPDAAVAPGADVTVGVGVLGADVSAQ
jgi:hypothetical protein